MSRSLATQAALIHGAAVHVLRGDRSLGKPSAFYYSTVLEGYKAAGFDVDILRTAVSESDELIEREI